MTRDELVRLCRESGLEVNEQSWTQVGPAGATFKGSRDPRIFYINRSGSFVDLRELAGPPDLIARARREHPLFGNGQIVARIPIRAFGDQEWRRLVLHLARPEGTERRSETRVEEIEYGPMRIRVANALLLDIAPLVDGLVVPLEEPDAGGQGEAMLLWDSAGRQAAYQTAYGTEPLELGRAWLSRTGSLAPTQTIPLVASTIADGRRLEAKDMGEVFTRVLMIAKRSGLRRLGMPVVGADDATAIEAWAHALDGAILDHVVMADGPPVPSSITVATRRDHAEVVHALREMGRAAAWTKSSAKPSGITSRAVSTALAGAAVGSTVLPGLGATGGGILGAVTAWVFKDAKVEGLTLDHDGRGPLPQEALPRGLLLALRESLQKALEEAGPVDVPPAEGRLPTMLVVVGGRYQLAPTIERATLRELEAAATFAWDAVGRPWPPSVRAAMQEAIGARNRIVHSVAENNHCDELLIAKGIELLKEWLPANALSSPAARAQPPAPLANTATVALPPAAREAERPDVPEPASVPTTSPGMPAKEPAPSGSGGAANALPSRSVSAAGRYGTQHVRKLRSLLQSRLSEAGKRDLLARLDVQSFVGDDELRLLEYCVQAKDLIRLVAEEFSRSELRAILKEEAGVEAPPEATNEALSRQILEHLGFPSMPSYGGIVEASRVVASARAKVQHGPFEELHHEIAEAVYVVERLLKLYLKFLTQWIFGKAPDGYFYEQGDLEAGYTIDRLTTGSLTEFILKVEKRLRASTELRLVELRRDLSPEAFLPTVAHEIAMHRNRAVHMRGKHDEKLSPQEVKESALAYLDGAAKVLEYLGRKESRVFPYVIRIDSISVDCYGRRTITAVSDGEVERHLETLFTDEEVAPGELYLMRPLTNPWRVDPVLIRAGDVGRRRPEGDMDDADIGE